MSDAQPWRVLRNALRRVAREARFHAIPLLIVAAVSALGQAALLAQTPLSYMSWDTTSYVDAAAKLATSPFHIDSTRTAGYPLFLTLIFKLTGGVDYAAARTCSGGVAGGTLQPQCQAIFGPVLVTQTALMFLSVFLCYLLTFRLSGRRLTAALVASLVGCNLYIISWERAMQTELLSVCCVIATFVVYERLVRRPSALTAVLFAAVSFVDILVRPFNVYLALLLLTLLLLRLAFLRQLRRFFAPVALSASLIVVCLVGYMSLNARVNGLFGLTWVTNIDVLGKVMEYHMQDLPVDPQYADIQSAVNRYMTNTPPGYDRADPWSVTVVYPAVSDGGFERAGAYARQIIIRNPALFVANSIPDILRTWQAQPEFYAVYGRASGGHFHSDPSATPGVSGYPIYGFGVAPTADEPGWVNALLIQSTFVLGAYWLLPFILLALAILVWRLPRKHEAFVMLTLAVAVVCAIGLGAVGDFAEFYRMRSPVDWAMILLAGVLVAEAVTQVAQVTHDRATVAPAGTESSQKDAVDTGSLVGATSVPMSRLGLGARTLTAVRFVLHRWALSAPLVGRHDSVRHTEDRGAAVAEPLHAGSRASSGTPHLPPQASH